MCGDGIIEHVFKLFGFILTTFSPLVVAILLVSRNKQYYGLSLQSWYIKLKINWEWIQDVLLAVFCLLSIAFIDADRGLLELTTFQSIIIFILMVNYTFNLISHFILHRIVQGPTLGTCYQLENIDIAHDSIGLIGCFYLLCTHCGGGMMVRLLLDVLTNPLCSIRDHFPQWFCGLSIRQRLCDKLFWIICIGIRICYYPFVLLETLDLIIEFMSNADTSIHYHILFILIICWFIFSMFYQISWIRNNFNYYKCQSYSYKIIE